MALPRLNSPFLLFYPAIERHVSQTGLAAEPAQAKTRFEILLNPLGLLCSREDLRFCCSRFSSRSGIIIRFIHEPSLTPPRQSGRMRLTGCLRSNLSLSKGLRASKSACLEV